MTVMTVPVSVTVKINELTLPVGILLLVDVSIDAFQSLRFRDAFVLREHVCSPRHWPTPSFDALCVVVVLQGYDNLELRRLCP